MNVGLQSWLWLGLMLSSRSYSARSYRIGNNSDVTCIELKLSSVTLQTWRWIKVEIDDSETRGLKESQTEDGRADR